MGLVLLRCCALVFCESEPHSFEKLVRSYLLKAVCTSATTEKPEHNPHDREYRGCDRRNFYPFPRSWRLDADTFVCFVLFFLYTEKNWYSFGIATTSEPWPTNEGIAVVQTQLDCNGSIIIVHGLPRRCCKENSIARTSQGL